MKRRQADSHEDTIEYRRAESRTLSRGDEWFFSSREGEHGPFATEAQAEEAMEAYVQLIDLRPENERPVTPDGY